MHRWILCLGKSVVDVVLLLAWELLGGVHSVSSAGCNNIITMSLTIARWLLTSLSHIGGNSLSGLESMFTMLTSLRQLLLLYCTAAVAAAAEASSLPSRTRTASVAAAKTHTVVHACALHRMASLHGCHAFLIGSDWYTGCTCVQWL